MKHLVRALLGAASLMVAAPSFAETTLTIATVNNSDMIRMQGLTSDFTTKNPDIAVKWVTLEENVLRQRVTTDIATKGGQFDVLTIGTYEVPIWAKQNWLIPLDNLGAAYDVSDLLPKIRDAVSVGGKLYGAPFYGESSMMMYRTDLFQKAGLTMPEQPTWDFVVDAAKKLTDKSAEVYGICLRGKAGWGENMAFLTAMANSFGARWFDEKWEPQFNTPEWKKTLTTYVDLMKAAGPPGASSNGFNENLALFNAGKCAMWIDATVAASFVTNPKDSNVADKVGFALAPNTGLGKNANWLWAWNLAIPAGSKKVDAAEKFIAWATGKGYTELVASKEGWANVPPGTRSSLYQNPEYLKAAPFAKLTLASIDSADPNHPTVKPVPYVGVQYAAIPEFQGLGTTVGQDFSAALSGAMTVDAALESAIASRAARLAMAIDPEASSSRLGGSMATEQTRGLGRLLITPAVAALFVWMIVPLVMTIYFSTLAYNLLNPGSESFIGLENYTYFLTDPAFIASLVNTLVLVGSVLAITVVIGTLVALLLDQAVVGRSIVRLMVIAPFFVMPTVSALVWKNLLMHPVSGLFAWIATSFGLRPIDWFAEAPLLAIILIVAWQWLPFATLILLTALQSLDEEQKEAAEMDGAGAFSSFFHITLPHLARPITVVILIETIFLLTVFAEIYVTTGGGPGLQTTNIAFLIYSQALIQFDVGTASAGGLVAVVLANIVAFFLVRIVGKNLEA